MSALEEQEAGNHYLGCKIQPAEYIYANRLGGLEGKVIWYLTRWRAKNGLEDLKKARHTIDILIELHEAELKQEREQLFKEAGYRKE